MTIRDLPSPNWGLLCKADSLPPPLSISTHATRRNQIITYTETRIMTLSFTISQLPILQVL